MAPFSLAIVMGPKQMIYINHILLEVSVSQKGLSSKLLYISRARDEFSASLK
jgi:hypothetical protein